MQLVYAVVACAVPLLARGYGNLAMPRPASVGDTPVAIISQVDDNPELILQFASSVATANPELILWSDVALGETVVREPAQSRESVQAFLTRLSSVWDTGPKASDEEGTRQEDRTAGTVLLTGRGRLVAVYLSPKEPPDDSDPQPGEDENRIYLTSRGSFGLGIDFEYLLPPLARRASTRGAQLLVSSILTEENWGEKAHQQQLNMQSFRAVENRRWLVYASSTDAYLIDPYGSVTLQLRRGFDSAGVESVSFLKEKSFYTLYGWCIEPLSLFVAVVIMAAAMIPRSRSHRRG